MNGNKNKLGIWAIITLGVMLMVVAMVVGQQANQPNDQVVNEPPVIEQPTPDPAWLAELPSPPAGWQWYKNAEFEFAFQYPGGWEKEERGPWRDSVIGQTVFKVSLEPVVISVYEKPYDLDLWFNNGSYGYYIREGQLDLTRDKATVNGRQGYIWDGEENGRRGWGLIILGEQYLYVLGFFEDGDVRAVEQLIKSFTINGQTGTTILPLDLTSVGNIGDGGILLADCEACGESDPVNSYDCQNCEDGNGNPRGNCTWKCEEQREKGVNNFRFGGVQGRNAYRWMSLEFADNDHAYAQGGTVPRVGAVLVAMKTFGGGLGHVATITGINSDGSIQVTEQNCYISCTRTRSYGPDWFADNLAGYIYPSEQLPFMTPKQLLTVGETIIDDYNRGRTEYNFATKGPGSPLPENDNELAWGFDKACGVGFNCYFHYMLSSDSVQGRRNGGRWFAWVIEPGLYELEAWIPDTPLAQATVHYVVGGLKSSHVKQVVHRDSWAQVRNPDHRDGYWSFSQTGEVRVRLPDSLAIERNRWIVLDAIRFTRRG